MLEIYLLACDIMILILSLLIRMMICFLDSPLVVMLSLSLSFNLFLLAIFYILIILPSNNLGNIFLILRISPIFPLVT